MNQLTRVQVYLNPDDLSFIDQIVSGIKINRSQIIRDAVSAVANNYVKTVNLITRSKKPRVKTWIELIGFETSKTGDLGLRVDEIYHDKP